jgi:hypothetical protein
MGRRQRQWAKSRHKGLIASLGGVCENCGSTEDLEVDHPNGRDYKLVAMDQTMRLARYFRELDAGVKLRVLCSSCNKILPPKREKSNVPVEEPPF